VGLFAVCWLAAGSVQSAGPPASGLDPLRSSAGFALALQPRQFEFPRDHGPHPAFRHEWWYVTGNLDSSRGERFGFELTFFRIGLAPPGVGTGAASDTAVSAWRTHQIYVAHFAITDVARGEFHFAQKVSRGAVGLAGAQSQPFRVWLDDWRLGAAAGPHGPDEEGGVQAGWMLHAAGQGYELSLEAEPLLAPVLNGEQGLSRRSDEPGVASYYYSIPRVAVHGKLARAGSVVDARGLAWFDREWASGSMDVREQGWDWFALQLQDGSALMFYNLRNRDGTRDSHSSGTWVDSLGGARALTADQVVIEVLDHWTGAGGARYPSRWRVRVPTVGLDAEVRPVLPDQELRTAPRYWEGAVDVHGTSEGRGYVELVGYGN
jgi:predicted secreted hydrolase